VPVKKDAGVKVGVKIVTANKKARADYFIEDTFEAGMALMGTEVKSLREGRANLKDSYAREKDGQIVLVGAHISPYPFGNRVNHEPERERRLLLHKQEIRRLVIKTRERGYTLVPLAIYFKDGKAKLEIGLGKGKAQYDKRETIKKREQDREMARAIRGRGR
jgi:SsrA-binding protein